MNTNRRPYTSKARPILWRRDYEAARKLLKTTASTSDDDNRFLALLDAIYDYERNRPSMELLRIVEWAECVFVPGLPSDEARSRRWSDSGSALPPIASFSR
jgi:hypothetical protein